MAVKAIIVSENGGPEVLEWGEVPLAKPGNGEVLIRHTAVGLNFIDIYHRTGLYPVPVPFTPGLEAAGIVEALGGNVEALKIGDRVAYPAGPLGAYAESRIIPAARLWKLPDAIDDETAAAMMLKGCTAEYLIRRTYKVQPGDIVLFHAAAGGVGSIATQWLNALGAIVIGTVGSEQKAALAHAQGCHHTILYREENFAEQVAEITAGRGVDVVYDSVGRDTFIGSLDCLKPRGMMVSFGNATGPVDPVPPGLLGEKGGLYLTRPSIMQYYAGADDFAAGCGALIDVVTSGAVKIPIGQRFPLEEAAAAHQALESRETTGSTILTID